MGEKRPDRRVTVPAGRDVWRNTGWSGRTGKGLEGGGSVPLRREGREGWMEARQTEAGPGAGRSGRLCRVPCLVGGQLCHFPFGHCAKRCCERSRARFCAVSDVPTHGQERKGRPRRTTAGHRLAPDVPDDSRSARECLTLPQTDQVLLTPPEQGKVALPETVHSAGSGPVWQTPTGPSRSKAPRAEHCPDRSSTPEKSRPCPDGTMSTAHTDGPSAALTRPSPHARR